MMKKIKILLSFVSLFISLQVISVCADEIPEGYYWIRNCNSNMYLYANGASNGSNIQQEPASGNVLPQKFKIIQSDVEDYEDYFTMELSQGAVKVVDVDGANTANEANIQLYEYNSTKAQLWKFISNNDGTFRIGSGCTNGSRVLTVDGRSLKAGANVFQYDYNASKNDQWYMEAAIEEGTYLIRDKVSGLYLTINGAYAEIDEYKDSNYQKFHIKGQSDGYYDIMPIADEDYSLSVRGWDYGTDNENAQIVSMVGQSSEGQSWRFIVNGDGTYRIMSQLSNCQKSMTLNSRDTRSQVYSATYNVSKMANWELIRVNPTENTEIYQKKGRHLVVDLSTRKFLNKNISPKNLSIWIEKLDKIYDGYKDLVGFDANGGKMIRIIADYTTPPYGAAWVSGTDNIVHWEAADIGNQLSVIKTGDWSFCIMHEFGHLFDGDGKWVFNGELSANLKMALVLKKIGNFRFTQNGKAYTNYQELLNYYKCDSGNSYTKTLGASVPQYEHDGLMYMILEKMGNDTEFMREVYRDYNNMSMSEIPSSNVGKYELFLDKINEHSPDKSYLDNFLKDYGNVQGLIKSKL